MKKQIKDLDELKRKAKSLSGLDCFIALKYSLKSSKHIIFDGEDFYIENLIDGGSDAFTEKQLLESNIGKALRNGALYAD